MRNRTLVELWLALSQAEKDDFISFVHSKWCNTYQHPADQHRLLDYLSSDDDPDVEKAYEYVFQGIEWIENKLEKLLSATLKTMRRWIVLRRERHEAENQLEMALFFSKKGLHERFDKAIEEARDALRKDNRQYIERSLLEYEVEYAVSSHHTLYNLRKDDANFHRTLTALDRFFLAARLKNTALLHQQARLVNISLYPVQQFVDALREEITLYPEINDELVQLYNYLYGFEAGLTTDFEAFWSFLQESHHYFPAETLDLAAISGNNYLIGQYNRTHERAHLEQAFDLANWRLQYGKMYNAEKQMRVSDFQLMVALGLLLHKYDWTQSFLEQHQDRLFGVKHPEDAWKYNYANMLAQTGKAAEALDYLEGNYEEFQYKISAKLLEIKILYETDSPILLSRLDAAKVYFFREKKLQKEQKEYYNNFVDMVKQMTNPKMLGNKTKTAKLADKVRKTDAIAEKAWLLDQLEALGEKRW